MGRRGVIGKHYYNYPYLRRVIARGVVHFSSIHLQTSIKQEEGEESRKTKNGYCFHLPKENSEKASLVKKIVTKFGRTLNGSCGLDKSTTVAFKMPTSLKFSHKIRSIHGDESCLAHSSSTFSSRKLWTTTSLLMGRRSSKIATRKTAQDARKSKTHGMIGKQIISAIKRGGSSNPASNSILAGVLQTAKDLAVPKDIIERNIKKASEKDQQEYMESTYEVYGFGGVGIVVEALTDNVNRTAPIVRDTVRKNGAKMANSGSVLFNFKKAGLIYVRADKVESDALLVAAMDAGAEDVLEPTTYEDDDDQDVSEKYYKVATPVDQYTIVKNKLQDAGIPIDSENSGLELIPTTTVEADDEAMELNKALMEKLLELDDIHGVYSNQA